MNYLIVCGFIATWFLEAYLLLAAWFYSTPPGLMTASLGAFLALSQGCRWLDTLLALLERTR